MASRRSIKRPPGPAEADVPGEPKVHAKSSKLGSLLARLGLVVGAVALVGGAAFYALMPKAKNINLRRRAVTPHRLLDHCEKHIGPPRVIEVTNDIFVAIGYDLANTILIRTSEGHVVVDVGMSTERAEPMRQALEAAAGTAPIHSIIYTHSHVDHVGGADTWAENGTRVWATDELMPHFFKQYGVFRKIETLRGARQFGMHVGLSELPCSGLGRKADMHASLRSMTFRVPTDTFTGKASFTAGGLTFELVEAHGETHDQLFVWVPERRALLCGDNYYESFPNLYTVRGTSPRPIRKWVRSLDDMRRYEPEFLIPSHTQPVIGREKISKQLTDYRDGIQWVLTSTIRGANEGKTMAQLAEEIALPAHLRNQSALDELYGQIDWSVRAIYTNELGWFDGRAEDLYPMPLSEEKGRLIATMGGSAKVLGLAKEAIASKDWKWGLYLVNMLKDGAKGDANVDRQELMLLETEGLRGLGEGIFNTNGRGYLFEAAKELSNEAPIDSPVVQDALIKAIPVDLIFEVMINRVVPELAIDDHQTALYIIGGTRYYLTVRRGLAEVVKDKPLLGTPEPIGTFITTEDVFRQIALRMTTPALEVAKGTATIGGNPLSLFRMLQTFETGA